VGHFKAAIFVVVLLLLGSVVPASAGQFENGFAAYKRGDFGTALRIWLPLAERGDAGAQNNVGYMYSRGDGVPRNFEIAASWFQKSANQGHADGLHNLGLRYANGEGVPRDDAMAATLFLKAAKQGHAGAETEIGIRYAQGKSVAQDDATAVSWFRKAANQGYGVAQNNLGFMYASGRGVPKNFTVAVDWFRKAAAQGSAEAQDSLGDRYENGEGVPRDQAIAVSWFRKAADQGHARAQNSLGRKYASGEGVARNDELAAAWVRKSAEQGFDAAQYNLGLLYAQGTGVRQDYVAAASWFAKAAEQRFVLAEWELGRAYFNGQGVQQDYVVARMWLTLAAAGGNKDAADSLKVIDTKMTAKQIAEAQKRAAERQPEIASTLPAPSQQQQQPPQVAAAPAPESKAQEAKVTSGTAFFVSKDGRVLTNAHVVEACREVEVIVDGRRSSGTVVGKDDGNDLALIATDLHPVKVAHWRLHVRRGEDVVVYGFPLADVLASTGNVATGNVTALAGIANDSRHLQISAPVQPGNSGGPLFDRNGNVIGIVVSKLNALKVAELIGDIPQNINFAIKASAAAAFLEAHRVEYDDEKSTDALSTPDIADLASTFTLQVVCRQ
jgi:TPR repeat protein